MSAKADVTAGHDVVLTSDVIPNLAKLTPAGDAPSSQFMQAIVAIANPNHDAAVSYESALSDPTSGI